MQQNRNIHLIIKILVIGGFMTSLIYLFHPEIGQFSLVINGEPVADPLIRFAAIPTILAVLLFTGILMVLAFFGIGLLIFIVAFLFMVLAVFIVAPYFWPLLVIIFLMIVLMFFSEKNHS
ncbi:MAG: hypothetical protein DRQ62_09640 [Gammaproteobacteria bacterium]|jgi:hypothetical protein|nr:MAG: hypothetical protein DRQ62_09640 [Gammaproteobacteria bacterium]